jgi:hypothetical protein
MATKNTQVAHRHVAENDFPKNGGAYEQMQFLLNYAVLAPSFYNSQPWKFSIEDEPYMINIYVNDAHWLKAADPNKRELYISLGCALENLLVAINYFGLGHSVAYFPENNDENWAARVHVVTGRESIAPRPKELFGAISRMRVHHQPYNGHPILNEHMSSIGDFLVNYKYEDTDMKHNIRLETSDDSNLRQQVGQLVAHGDAIIFADAAFRRELSAHLDHGKYGSPWFITEPGKPGKVDAQLGEYIAEREMKIVSSATMIGILTSNIEDPTALIKIGQAYERIALEATLVGIGIYPIFQLTELMEMKNTVRDLFPGLHGYPQLAFAMGYVNNESDIETFSRFPVEEVMLHAKQAR